MDLPSCSNLSSVDSSDFDLPEIPSVIMNEPHRTESMSEFPTAERHQRPTECAICGKPANGYHYDVASCNGCKTFFRRLCISERNFTCKTNKDCFDLTKREHPVKCRACRYEKCISVGMNPMAMKIDEQEATAENFKKLTKRIRQSNGVSNEDPDMESVYQIQKKQITKDITTIENKMQKLIDMLSYLESKVAKFKMSSYNPHWKTLPGLEGFLLMENKICLGDKSGPMPGWPFKTQSGPPTAPNFAKLNGPQYSPEKKQWFLYDLMVSVEYAKTFNFFHKLDFKDRLILIRYVALALMNIHISYFTVTRKYDSVIHPDGSLAPMAKGIVYAKTVMSIGPLIRCDIQEKEYVLLKAICLCNPAVPDLSAHAVQIIAKERQQYAEALFDQCMRYRKDGPRQFAELIGLTDLLERQQRMQKDLHLLHVAPFVQKIPKEEKMLLVEDIMNC